MTKDGILADTKDNNSKEYVIQARFRKNMDVQDNICNILDLVAVVSSANRNCSFFWPT